MTMIDPSGVSRAVPAIKSRSEWDGGKMMLVSAAMGVGLSAIPTFTLGVFIAPLSRDLGWPPETIVLAQSLTALIIGLGSPFAGILLDRLGARPMVLLGATIQSCAIASLSLLTPSLWLYFTLWAVLGAGVVLSSPVVWLRPVVERFVRNRGLASSLVFCGSNVAGMITPLLVTYLVLNHGWRAAYLGLGLYMAVSSLPLALFFLHDSKTLAKKGSGQVPAADTQNYGLTTGEAIRNRNFWILAPSFFIAGAGVTSYIVHLVPMLTERGVSPLLAASTVSALSISSIVGGLTAGFLMDRLFAPRIAAFALFLPVVASAILLFASGPFWPGLVAAILIGLTTGAELDMISYLAARYFGMRSYGRMSGLLYGMFTLGSLIGAPLIARSVTMTGNFRMGQLSLGVAFAVASMIMLGCSAYPKFTRAEP